MIFWTVLRLNVQFHADQERTDLLAHLCSVRFFSSSVTTSSHPGIQRAKASTSHRNSRTIFGRSVTMNSYSTCSEMETAVPGRGALSLPPVWLVAEGEELVRRPRR